ncbi:MAG: hypothetical protein R3F19_19215 [Verrucomicrobiales bacterium]|nr:hypothetical protein [Verrucomicrobiae bacterium]
MNRMMAALKKYSLAALILIVLFIAEWQFQLFSHPHLEGLLSVVVAHPWVLFLAIAILPGLGVPNCPLMIVGGGAIAATGNGADLASALWVTVGGVIVNILWTYWVAAYPLRSFLWKRVARSGGWFTGMKSDSVLFVTFLLHVTPGVPLFIQNYFPGVHRLAYWKYLAIAIPVQSLYTALIVVTSGKAFSAFGGSLAVALACFIALWALGKAFAPSRRSIDRSVDKV